MESNDTLADLLKRIEALEAQVRDLQGRIPQTDEETIQAIVAGVAAYMGVKAKVRAIHTVQNSSRWTAAARRSVHNRNLV